MPSLIDRVVQTEAINFALTNRVPRRALTRFIGWLSRIEQPLVRDLSIAIWRLCAGDLSLHEAKRATFDSLHDCFIRELKHGVRPIDRDPRVVVSPCDGIVGATGVVRDNEILQAKGSPYGLDELLADDALARRFRGGHYVTLRLTSAMYHRFHAPADCRVHQTTYISGDMWNVNPVAVKRIARLYCQNERAVIQAQLANGQEVVLVAVGAILVASIHLNFVDVPLTMKYDGPSRIQCDARYQKGEELGYFHHGSTIIVVAPASLDPCAGVREGQLVHVGAPLFRFAQYAEAE